MKMMTDRKEKIMMKLYHTEKKDNEKVYYLDREHVVGLFAKMGKTDGDLIKVMTVLLGLPGDEELELCEKEMAEWTGMDLWSYRNAMKRLREKGALHLKDDKLVVNIGWVNGKGSVCSEQTELDDDDDIRTLLADIGVDFSSYTRKVLEEIVQERLDVNVLREVIYDHPDSWIPEARKKQQYYFTVLKDHVRTDYQKVKKRLWREREMGQAE